MARQQNSAAAKDKADQVKAAPKFTKEQLVRAKTLDLPRDAIMAVLEDGKSYTKEDAVKRVSDFLERKV